MVIIYSIDTKSIAVMLPRKRLPIKIRIILKLAGLPGKKSIALTTCNESNMYSHARTGLWS